MKVLFDVNELEILSRKPQLCALYVAASQRAGSIEYRFTAKYGHYSIGIIGICWQCLEPLGDLVKPETYPTT